MAVTDSRYTGKASSVSCYGDDNLLSKEITTADITWVLEMTGYFDYYTPERIQLVGMKNGPTW